MSEVIFDADALSPGQYVVSARVVGPDGEQIGKDRSTTVAWAGRPDSFKGIKILNNLCWELVSATDAAGDYLDLMNERSNKHMHGVSISLGNGDVQSGATQSVQAAFPHPPFAVCGKFSRGDPYWMDYHWRVFRAKGHTATLTVSDRKSETDPGGPIGQELMFNFIEIQPYIGD